MKIHVSGIFLETAWRVKKCRQTTHLHCVIFGFLERNCLAACPWPLGDAYCTTQFSEFLDEAPGSDEHSPGDTNQFWFDFDVLDVLG